MQLHYEEFEEFNYLDKSPFKVFVISGLPVSLGNDLSLNSQPGKVMSRQFC